jgi:LysR family hydrogen peroxide-inducible transcriptional activator
VASVGPVISREPRWKVTYAHSQSSSTATRLRKPIRKGTWTAPHSSQASRPPSLTLPKSATEWLLDGTLDVAVMAQPEAFDERLDVQPLYRERFVVAFPAGHRFERRNALRFSDMDGEYYLLRINCEFQDQLGALCRSQGAKTKVAYRSEREDWIQVMVAGGLGVCFTPEYSPTVPGVMTRAVVDPEVARDVSLLAISGRRFSPAVAAFVKAIKAYPWPQDHR